MTKVVTQEELLEILIQYDRQQCELKEIKSTDITTFEFKNAKYTKGDECIILSEENRGQGGEKKPKYH